MVSVKEIDSLLPQTQCGECGFSGCLPYAEALAQGKSTIDRCPPGGIATVKALATLFNIEPDPYLPAALANTRPPALAEITEAECIGCTKCIQACPVDAIMGSGKLMHTIITTECTGCGLCVEPCPVDCIELTPIPTPTYDKNLARQRFHARQARLISEAEEKQKNYRDKHQSVDTAQGTKAKQEYILQALARVQAKKVNHE